MHQRRSRILSRSFPPDLTPPDPTYILKPRDLALWAASGGGGYQFSALPGSLGSAGYQFWMPPVRSGSNDNYSQPLAAFLSHWVITWQEALPDMSDSILLSTRQQRPPFHPWIVTGAEHLFSFLSAAAPGFMLIGEL